MNTVHRFVALGCVLLLFVSVGLAEECEKPDDPPVPVRTPPPEYPSQLKRERVSGMVVVNLVIAADGSVTDAAARNSTHPDFDQSALDAVKLWKFKPARKDGNAIRSRVALPSPSRFARRRANSPASHPANQGEEATDDHAGFFAPMPDGDR